MSLVLCRKKALVAVATLQSACSALLKLGRLEQKYDYDYLSTSSHYNNYHIDSRSPRQCGEVVTPQRPPLTLPPAGCCSQSSAGKQSQHGGYSTLLCFYKVSSFYKHPANLSHTNWNAIERARFSSQNETENSLFGDSEVKIWECHILILVLSTANFILIRSLSLSLNSSAASSLISRGWMELMIIFTLYSKPNITRLINSLFQFS